MRKPRVTEEWIIGILQEHATGGKLSEPEGGSSAGERKCGGCRRRTSLSLPTLSPSLHAGFFGTAPAGAQRLKSRDEALSLWVPFLSRFSRQPPSFWPARSGADARFPSGNRQVDVCRTCLRLTLDQESPGSIPGGATA